MKRLQGRPPKQRHLDVPRALVKAAQRHLNRDFTENIRVTRLASDAGVQPCMINYYFGGKDGLFISLFEDAILGFGRQLQELTKIKCSPADLIEAVIAVTDQHVTDTLYMRNLAFREMSEPSTRMHEAYQRVAPIVHRRITKVLMPLYAHYADGLSRAQTASVTIISACAAPLYMRNFFKHTFLMEPDGEDRARYRKTLAAMLAPCTSPSR